MKILQVNCVYRKGSTGKIVYDIHKQLESQCIDSIVCYGRGKKVHEPNVFKVCSEFGAKWNNFRSRITGIMYGGCVVSTNKLISIIKKENPDIVHLHCINGYFTNIYRLVRWLKQNRMKTVLTLHAEFMYTGGCGCALECDKWNTGCGKCPRLKKETKSFLLDGTHRMWRRMRNTFDNFEDDLTVVSVSPWLMQRAKKSLILGNKKHCVVFNGIDTDVYKAYDGTELKAKHQIVDEKIIFHVTPYFCNDPKHIKGGRYVLQLAEMLGNNVKIVVAGKYDQKLNLPPNMIMLGEISNQEKLAKYYSMADVTVLTSEKETFSMIVAESLCCGTPVVGFKAGAPEQITISEYSDFVEYGDVRSLKDVINKWLNRKVQSEKMHMVAAGKYGKDNMTAEYMAIYLNMRKEKNDEF